MFRTFPSNPSPQEGGGDGGMTEQTPLSLPSIPTVVDLNQGARRKGRLTLEMESAWLRKFHQLMHTFVQ